MNKYFCRKFASAIIAILCTLNLSAAPRALYGVVISSDNDEPVAAAIVRLNTQDWAATDADGRFTFTKLNPGKYEYEVSYLGYETARGEFSLNDSIRQDIIIRLNPSNLALKEVVVTAEEGKMGEDANNALGTAIVVDGTPISNDANMQVFSTARSGSSSSVQQVSMNDQTTSGRGVDLRQISPDNIESIEVIRGIPSVEYGNLTSGAVIINTKAGVTPWTAQVKVDPNSKLLSVGKGLRLRGNGGSLNFGLDYTKSNADLRKTYLGYDRITANAAYSKIFLQTSTPLSFNVNATYYRNLSDTKSDEAMLKDEYFKNLEQSFRLAVNGMWRLNRKAISNLSYSASFQYTHQEDIYNRYIGSGVVPYSHSYVPGEMQVGFLPATYLCNYKLDGKPLNVFAQLKANRTFLLPRGTVNVKLGVDYNLNANHGGGMMYDPSLPPVQGEGQSVRPRSYSELPSLSTLSVFAEGMTEYHLGSTILTLQPGVRAGRMFIDSRQALRGDITTVDPRVIAHRRLRHSLQDAHHGVALSHPGLL